MPHSKLPWKACDCGKCGFIWTTPGDHLVATVTSGDWGDDYPTIKVEGGICQTAKPVMEQITYGHVPQNVAKANANLIITAVNVMPEVVTLLCRIRGYSNGILDQFQNRSGHLDVTGLKSFIEEIGDLLEKLEGIT